MFVKPQILLSKMQKDNGVKTGMKMLVEFLITFFNDLIKLCFEVTISSLAILQRVLVLAQKQYRICFNF